MSLTSMVFGAVKALFNAFRKVFLPDKKDLIGSVILTVPLYLLFGLSLIFLLPLIILGVLLIFIIRRLWKVLIIWWTLRAMKKKTTKEINRIKGLFK
ncbi:MAG: hypothetical protein V1744_00045 [Candidatus Altiarchaeota archaeon]